MASGGGPPRPGSGRGSTIAEQIARLRSGPPVPKEQRGSPSKFWWQQDAAQQQAADGISSSSRSSDARTAGDQTHKGAAKPAAASTTLALLQEVSSSNPELFKALMSMERDPSGRLSASTLGRIQSILEAGRSSGSPTASGSSAAGSVSFGGQGTASASSGRAPGSPPGLAAEESADSLHAAMSRYRNAATADVLPSSPGPVSRSSSRKEPAVPAGSRDQANYPSSSAPGAVLPGTSQAPQLSRSSSRTDPNRSSAGSVPSSLPSTSAPNAAADVPGARAALARQASKGAASTHSVTQGGPPSMPGTTGTGAEASAQNLTSMPSKGASGDTAAGGSSDRPVQVPGAGAGTGAGPSLNVTLAPQAVMPAVPSGSAAATAAAAAGAASSQRPTTHDQHPGSGPVSPASSADSFSFAVPSPARNAAATPDTAASGRPGSQPEIQPVPLQPATGAGPATGLGQGPDSNRGVAAPSSAAGTVQFAPPPPAPHHVLQAPMYSHQGLPVASMPDQASVASAPAGFAPPSAVAAPAQVDADSQAGGKLARKSSSKAMEAPAAASVPSVSAAGAGVPDAPASPALQHSTSRSRRGSSGAAAKEGGSSGTSSRSVSPTRRPSNKAMDAAAAAALAAASSATPGELPPPPVHLEKIYNLAKGVGAPSTAAAVAAAAQQVNLTAQAMVPGPGISVTGGAGAAAPPSGGQAVQPQQVHMGGMSGAGGSAAPLMPGSAGIPLATVVPAAAATAGGAVPAQRKPQDVQQADSSAQGIQAQAQGSTPSAAPVLQGAVGVASSGAPGKAGAMPPAQGVPSSAPNPTPVSTTSQPQQGTTPAQPMSVGAASSPLAVHISGIILQPPPVTTPTVATAASVPATASPAPAPVAPAAGAGTSGLPHPPALVPQAPTHAQGPVQPPAPGSATAGPATADVGVGVRNTAGPSTGSNITAAGSSSQDSSLPPLDVSKGWPKGVPHGEPQIVPGIAGVRPPMIFVPVAPPSPPSPDPLLSPTHIFVPAQQGILPQLISVPGHPSYPLPTTHLPRSRSHSPSPSPPRSTGTSPNRPAPNRPLPPPPLPVQPHLAPAPAAATNSNSAGPSVAGGSVTQAAPKAGGSDLTFQPFVPPGQGSGSGGQGSIPGSSATQASASPSSSAAPAGTPGSTATPAAGAGQNGPAMGSALAAGAAGSQSTGAGGSSKADGTAGLFGSQPTAQPKPPVFGFTPPALPSALPGAAGSTGAAKPADTPAVVAKPGTAAPGLTGNSSSPGSAPAAPKPGGAPAPAGQASTPSAQSSAPSVQQASQPAGQPSTSAAGPSGSSAAPARQEEVKPVSIPEAVRRAQDIMELERLSPPRSRITRLVEEVESQRKRQKEYAIRMEEKQKLQKMKWEELETYLGQQATSVQDVRRLRWDLMSLQKDTGSTPPKKLAQSFLEKAEAVRSAALEAAVGRELERAAEAERQAEREAALLHTALDMQHALRTSHHEHSLREADLMGAAARAAMAAADRAASTLLSPSSYLQSRSAAASTLAGLGLHPDPSDPSWHRSLLAATSNASPTRHRPAGEGFTSASHTHLAGAYSARPVTATGTAIQDPVSPSSSSSSGSSSPSASPAGRVKKEKKRKEQGSAPAAGTAGGMPSTSPGVPTAAGGALGAVHPAVDEITRAARQISLQLDSAVSDFLRRTNEPRTVPVGASSPTAQGLHHPSGFPAPGPVLQSANVTSPGRMAGVPTALVPVAPLTSALPGVLPATLGGGHTGLVAPAVHGAVPAMYGTVAPVPALGGLAVPGSGLPVAPMVLPGTAGHTTFPILPAMPGSMATAMPGLMPQLPLGAAPLTTQAILLAQHQALVAQQAALAAQQQHQQLLAAQLAAAQQQAGHQQHQQHQQGRAVSPTRAVPGAGQIQGPSSQSQTDHQGHAPQHQQQGVPEQTQCPAPPSLQPEGMQGDQLTPTTRLYSQFQQATATTTLGIHSQEERLHHAAPGPAPDETLSTAGGRPASVHQLVVVGQEHQPGGVQGGSSSQVHHPSTAQPRPPPLTTTGPPAQFPAGTAQAGYGSPGGGAGGVPSGISSQGLLVGMRSPSVHPHEGLDGSTRTATLQMATAPVLSESTSTTGPLPSVFQAALPQAGTAGLPPQQQQQAHVGATAGVPISGAPPGLGLPASGMPGPQGGNVFAGALHYAAPRVPQASLHDPAAAAGAGASAPVYAPQQHQYPQHLEHPGGVMPAGLPVHNHHHHQQPGGQQHPVAMAHVGTTSTVLQPQQQVLHQSIASVLQSASNPATETGTHCTAPMFPQWPGLGPVPGQDLPSVTQLPLTNSVTITPHHPPALQHPTAVLPHAPAQPAPLPLQPVVPTMPGSGLGIAGNAMPVHSHHPGSPGRSSSVAPASASYAGSYSSDVPYYGSFHSAPSVAGQGQGPSPFTGNGDVTAGPEQPHSPGGRYGGTVPQQYSQQQNSAPAGVVSGPVGTTSPTGPIPHGTVLPGTVQLPQGAVQAAVPGSSYPVPASGRASPPLVHHPSNASSFTLSPERGHLLPRPRTPITPHLGVDDGVVRAAAQSTSPRPGHAVSTQPSPAWAGGGGGDGGSLHPAAASRGNIRGSTAHAAGRSHPAESESEAESDPGYTSTLSTIRGKETHIDMLVLDDARSSDDASLSQVSDLRASDPTDRMAQKLSSRPEPWQHSTRIVHSMPHAPSSPAQQPPEAVGEQGSRHHGGAVQALGKQSGVGGDGAANESKQRQHGSDWGQLSSGHMGSGYDARQVTLPGSGQVTLPQPGPSHSQTLSYTIQPGGTAWQATTTTGRADASTGVPPPTQSRSTIVLAPPHVMGNNTATAGAAAPLAYSHPTWPAAQHLSGAVLQPAFAPQVALTVPAQLQGYNSWGSQGIQGPQPLVQVPLGMTALATQHATQSTQRSAASYTVPPQYPGAGATLPAARPSQMPQNFQQQQQQQPVNSVPMQATEALARQAAAWAQSVGVSLPQPPPTLTGAYSTGGHTLGSTVSGSSTTRGGVLTTATLASPARHTSYTASSPLYNTGSSSASSAATLRPGVLPLGGSSTGSRAVPATAPAAILQHPQTAAQVGEAHVSQAYADTLQQLHAVYGGAHGSVGEGIGQPATSSAPSGSAAAAAAGSRNLTSMWSGSFN